MITPAEPVFKKYSKNIKQTTYKFISNKRGIYDYV